jgi:hypothetical protein
MTRMFTSALLTLTASIVSVQACGDYPSAKLHKRSGFERRQATPTYPTGPAYDVPPLASITPTPASYEENTLPVIATYTAGQQAPLSSAPPLPACTSALTYCHPFNCPFNQPSQVHIIPDPFYRYHRPLGVASSRHHTAHQFLRGPGVAERAPRSHHPGHPTKCECRLQ